MGVAVLAGAVAALPAAVPTAAGALEPPPVPIERRETDPDRRALEPRGAPLAKGTLHATLDSRLTFDSNVTAGHRPVPDRVATLAPAVSFHHGPNPWRLRLDAGAEDVRHRDHRRLDHRNLRGALRLWGGSHEGSRAHLATSWQRVHEAPGEVAGRHSVTRPVAVTTQEAEGALLLRRGLVSSGTVVRWRTYSFANGRDGAGQVVVQNDRDRRELDVSQRMTGQVWPSLTLIGESRLHARKVQRATARLGLDRSTVARGLYVGAGIDLPERFAAEALVGRHRQHFASPLFAPLTATVYEAAGTLALTTLTTITGKVWRRIGMTEAAAQAAAREEGWTVGVSHELLRQVVLSADVGRLERHQIGLIATPAEHDTLVRAGVLYRRDARWYGALEGRWDRRTGGEPQAPFARSRVILSLGARL